MKKTDISEQISKVMIRSLREERLYLKDALELIRYAAAKADSIGVPMVFTVLDDGANLIAQQRMDGALLAGIDVSYAKAYTAISLQTPTDELGKSVLSGPLLDDFLKTNPGKYCVLGGGIPIIRSSRYLGALGVSGGCVEQDLLVAEFAVSQFYGN